ncbi:MAG TPA: hypothetical protein VFY25_10090 [Anaerolineales bacterium]|nr:hypothetical protein [Anaerolineales bacterium]
MKDSQITLFGLSLKTIVAHTLTYFLIGFLAFSVFNYEAQFAQAEVRTWMRQTDDPIVALGPGLQPIRGIIFALAFYPLREVLFKRKNGWLITWWLLVALGILSTFGPTPGSVEGMIYLAPSSSGFFSGGMLEILTQSFLFSALLYYWVNHPHKTWLNWLLGVLFVLAVLMSIMGYLVAAGYMPVPA